MENFLKRSWAVIDLDAIAYNFQSIRKGLNKNCMVMGVVKADAYGHGDRFVAAELALLGVNWFGVSNIEEGLCLRRYGITQPILIFGPTPAAFAEDLIRYQLTQTVHSLDYAKVLQAAAQQAQDNITIHIKLDTGMSRLGFPAYEEQCSVALAEIKEVFACENLTIGGAFTHFAVADELCSASVEFTKLQYERFVTACTTLKQEGYSLPILHCCNSGGVVSYPEMQLDMVRPGAITYGLYPSSECQAIDIRPAMSLYTTVSMVKTVKAGTTLSYGRIFTAEKDMRIATVAIGYADGYDRSLSGRSRMLVHGEYAPVVGRICMDQLMLDVTHIPHVHEGDVVTVAGIDSGNAVTLDELATLAGTVNYEQCCRISRRMPRVYLKNGVEIGVSDYLCEGCQ